MKQEELPNKLERHFSPEKKSKNKSLNVKNITKLK